MKSALSEDTRDPSPTRRFNTPRFRGIQVLRIIAALMVLTTHSTFYTFERLVKKVPVWTSGAWGVDIFFVISGFVMICSYRQLFGRRDGWKVFIARRLERIVPMYWLATTAKLLIMLFSAGLVLHSQLSFRKELFSYLFLPAYSDGNKIEPLLAVGWSLNFEMFFYLLFAAAIFFRVNVYRFVGAILTLTAIASMFRKESWPAASFYLDAMGLEFFFGMVIARLCLAGRTLRPYFSIPLLFLGFALIVFPRRDWSPRVVQVGIPAALIVASIAWLEPYLIRIPAWVLFLGDASYVIYLFHPMVAPLVPTALFRLHVFNPVLSILGAIVLGVVVPSLIYRFVDAPVTSYLKARNRRLVKAAESAL